MDDILIKIGSVAILLVGLAVVGWIFDVVRKALSGDQQQQEQEVRRTYEEKDQARARFQETIRQRANMLLDQLQIQERDTSPFLHEPVYDCASDEFELPCSHDNFAHSYLGVTGGIGWFADRESVTKALEGRITVAQCMDYEYLAVVGNTTYLAAITEMEPGHPGGNVWRLVRTGVNQWYCYSWKAGFRPSAASVDPPFYVKDLLRNPALWDQRERTAGPARRATQHYQSALRTCRHRIAK